MTYSAANDFNRLLDIPRFHRIENYKKLFQERYTLLLIWYFRTRYPIAYTIVTREQLRTSKGITDLLWPTASIICDRYSGPSKKLLCADYID